LRGARLILEKAMPLTRIMLKYANSIAPDPEIKLPLKDHAPELIKEVTISILKKKPGRGGIPIILLIISKPIIDDALELRVLIDRLLKLANPLKNIIGRDETLYINSKIFHLW